DGAHAALAVILECIQGEGGVRPVSDAFAAALKDLRRRHGFLVIADEIQSGGFRTGPFLACEHWDLQPDLVTLAKPIGGGLPLGAILGAASVADVLQPGMHGTTFGGNPVACAAGVAVLEEIEEKGLATHAVAMGALLQSRLEEIAAAFPAQAREVRGRGLMMALELADDAAPVVEALRDRGILVNATERTVLRFVPPLVIGPEHIEQAAAALREVLGAR
ncbi:MAG TPA: aminotransferase class III-fold pyridoxal phosphate-dependent enzyme, partial [Candidatus Krumholzibacteria bacterium]|nr:aminotransferase class III-fold pyridoxal phosphate-dependent enzyme [Candidatus Krumholzibacteria bacterium]